MSRCQELSANVSTEYWNFDTKNIYFALNPVPGDVQNENVGMPMSCSRTLTDPVRSCTAAPDTGNCRNAAVICVLTASALLGLLKLLASLDAKQLERWRGSLCSDRPCASQSCTPGAAPLPSSSPAIMNQSATSPPSPDAQHVEKRCRSRHKSGFPTGPRPWMMVTAGMLLLAGAGAQKLVFRQTMSFLFTPGNVKHYNADDPTASDFSILDEVESMRGSDGKLHFKLCYNGNSKVCLR